MTFLSLVCVSEAKKKFVCFSADFWVAQVDRIDANDGARLFRAKKNPRKTTSDYEFFER